MLFDSLDEMSNDLWLGFDDRLTGVERGAMRLLTGLLIGVVFAQPWPGNRFVPG